MFAPDDLTEDEFLGGRVRLKQPKGGYRAGIDPVLLAAAVPAKPGETVLELGIGAGTASICLAARVPALSFYGIEIQPDYAALARTNAILNKTSLEVVETDVRSLPASLKARRFAHVIMNPPYFGQNNRTPAADGGREAGLSETVPLATWIDVASRRLAPSGWLTIIQRADRLPDLLSALKDIGSVEVKAITPRAGRDAILVMVRMHKGRRAPFRLAPPLVLHEGERHISDGDDYSATARAILRQGAALEF